MRAQRQRRFFDIGCYDWIWLSQCASVLAALTILCMTLWAYTSVHIWYPDDTRYFAQPPTTWIVQEGRWLQYLLFPLFKQFEGRIALFSNLLFLLVFLFIAAQRYIVHSGYAFAFAALCISASPLAHQLMWPSTTLPSIALLGLAALVVRMLPVYIFYVVFGTLFIGCMSIFYYLLPLLHLSLLTKPTFLANLRTLTIRIAPAWMGGYVVGQLVMLTVVYAYTFIDTGDGQTGLQIAEWRRPGDDYNDWVTNAVRSVEYLNNHLRAFTLQNKGIVAVAVAALAVGILNELRHFPAKLLLLGIVLAHYILIVPIGLVFGFRTSVPTAIGFAALLFLTPQAGRLKQALQTALLLCMSVAWSLQTVNTLRWETGVVEIYYNELLRVTPMSPELYAGVALLNNSSSISATTLAIERQLDLPSRNASGTLTMNVRQSAFWGPVAYEAGFKDIRLCGEDAYHAQWPLCREIIKRFSLTTGDSNNARGRRLYVVLGEYAGFLVLYIRPFADDLSISSSGATRKVDETE